MSDFKRLWAPWRIKFVAQGPTRGCFFCRAKRSKDDRRNYVVVRGTAAFVILNRYPYNNGHVMVVPYRHIGKLTLLSPAEWMECLELSQRLSRRLGRVLSPQGFNFGMNLGRVAGAGVVGHLHLHLVPRWHGDTNFMPVLTRTQVIAQSLDELYRLLVE